jgi:hypothetical protein
MIEAALSARPGLARNVAVRLIAERVDLWLLPIVVIAAWCYYPYCEHGPVLCLSRLLLHRRCPGCGPTRGICFLVHGRVRQAVLFNPLSPLVLGLMTLHFASDLRRTLKEVRRRAWSGCAVRLSNIA